MDAKIRVWAKVDQVAQVVWSGGFKYRNHEAIFSMARAGLDELDGPDKVVSAGRVLIDDFLAELELTFQPQRMSRDPGNNLHPFVMAITSLYTLG
jgi:hypothetical protein